MPKEKYIRICPKCGDVDVKPYNEMDMISWGGAARWRCNKCNYNAVLFPEVNIDEVEKFRKEIIESD